MPKCSERKTCIDWIHVTQEISGKQTMGFATLFGDLAGSGSGSISITRIETALSLSFPASHKRLNINDHDDDEDGDADDDSGQLMKTIKVMKGLQLLASHGTTGEAYWHWRLHSAHTLPHVGVHLDDWWMTEDVSDLFQGDTFLRCACFGRRMFWKHCPNSIRARLHNRSGMFDSLHPNPTLTAVKSLPYSIRIWTRN